MFPWWFVIWIVASCGVSFERWEHGAPRLPDELVDRGDGRVVE